MKIAVPTRNHVVDDHFGHCEYYMIYSIEDNKVIKSELLQAPQGCGCKSNIGAVLQQLGVKVMLAGNMGEGALQMLSQQGMDVYRGCSGNVEALVDEFLEGQVKDSGKGCHQHGDHEHGHQCNH
ncbi:MAG: dinitrogenase iron-molybdenum cofactor biosynthesis protein [Bacteroidetes bacterium GWF2_38_335]|nr:MAG: dinitrogenase iron-molybdenum cofactor biosynthesis protein [Bacteroidetes bacterium GWF2_38_335]OFY77220.1 MAG: dinitrogenase iron-molybdenum cofactor biosynthesis protein [Bacteroidetes bacterium RIFOXYA12_FULL_38_20]HBS85779.1 dinitrogenase iron-molybdenum cofactor biosynthesis protein [Bacteroidales bacterium]